MTVATNNHIQIDDLGIARIDGSRMKVIHLVKEMLARNSSPEALCEAFPHLSLAQVHAALSYYYDHQSQVDAQIKRELAEFDVERASAGSSQIRDKLRQSGLRP
jgi:uncharacterized protein (DUF433 family)